MGKGLACCAGAKALRAGTAAEDAGRGRSGFVLDVGGALPLGRFAGFIGVQGGGAEWCKGEMFEAGSGAATTDVGPGLQA